MTNDITYNLRPIHNSVLILFIFSARCNPIVAKKAYEIGECAKRHHVPVMRFLTSKFTAFSSISL
jgi:hypothetical protein